MKTKRYWEMFELLVNNFLFTYNYELRFQNIPLNIFHPHNS